MNCKIYTMSVCLLLAGIGAEADVIKTTMGEEKGTFSEYSSSKFILRTEKGDVEVPKASARELVLEKPVPVSLLRKGQSKPENAELIGYDKLQFKLKQDKKEVSLSAMYITSMRASIASSGGEGGEVVGSGDEPIPAINTSDIDESSLTEAQKSSLATYRAVRKRYEEFLSISSAMVAEMDRSAGPKREELLNKLRIRKNQEQPVRIEMSGAHKSLLAAFPNGLPIKQVNAPVVNEPVMPPPGESAKEVIEEIDEADGEVLLIDTEGLGKAGNLSDAQMKALDAYEKAALAYEQISKKQSELANSLNSAPAEEKEGLMRIFEQGEKDGTAAKKALLKAQKAFLKAFPQLQLTK